MVSLWSKNRKILPVPFPPPPTAESIAEKRSRVSIEDMDTTIDYTWTGH